MATSTGKFSIKSGLVPVAYMTHDKRMLIFADSPNMLPEDRAALIPLVVAVDENSFLNLEKKDFDCEYENGEWSPKEEPFLRGHVDGWNACLAALARGCE